MAKGNLYDVVILGGGPAGSAMASYLVKANVSCIVLEKEIFPRPHVGESLVPACNRVLDELGLMDKIESAGFVRKYGAAWSTHDGRNIYRHDWEETPDEVDITFYENMEAPNGKSYTFHVDRAKFDHILLNHARELGTEVLENCRVEQVHFNNDGVEVDCLKNKERFTVKAKMVVDASGRHAQVGKQLGLLKKDPVFQQCALHSWYTDFEREGQANADYIFVHFLPVSNTWIWQIPITETITSFGLVTQKQHFAKSKESWETFFLEMVKTKPALYDKLIKAKRIRPFTAEGDYSYKMTQFAGDRFMLIGDAARFVDPIFSSGVSVALNSARLGSYDVIKAVQTNNFGRPSFQDYERLLEQGCANWYEFISLYYRLNVLFTYFVNNKKHRADILQLLQGDVYDTEPPQVLKEMRAIVTEVEQNPNHVWHKLLGELTANEFRPQPSQ